MESVSLALYIDLENLPKGIDLGLLLRRLAEGEPPCVFAVKAAYGAAEHVSARLRDRLTEHNIRIVDTPHVTGKKNRADLIISIDAFERLHVGVPPVDRYVFITGDCDFSVIMDRLRSYRKQVWLVCPKTDQHKRLLLQSCDRVLPLDDFLRAAAVPAVVRPEAEHAEKLLKEVLRQIGPAGLPVSFSAVAEKMKRIEEGFDCRRCGFKQFAALARHCEEKGMIRTGHDAKGAARIEDADESQLGPREAAAVEPAPIEPAASPEGEAEAAVD